MADKTMTTRDFEIIAQVLNEFFDDTSGDEIDLATFEYLANRFADALAKTNPEFNRQLFLKKAGAK